MTLPYSTNLVSELQYWFEKYIRESELNRSEIPSPVSIPDIYLKPKSFIEMLFQDNYPYNSYEYYFQDASTKSGWASVVRDRLCIYPSAKIFEICDSEAAFNLFDLKEHDLILLDALLVYRMDSTALTIVDSTSVYLIETTMGVTLGASLEALNTNLSKLIYLYLNLKVNSNFENYDNLDLISNPTNILEASYEAFLIEQMFKYMSSKDVEGGWS